MGGGLGFFCPVMPAGQLYTVNQQCAVLPLCQLHVRPVLLFTRLLQARQQSRPTPGDNGNILFKTLITHTTLPQTKFHQTTGNIGL